MIEPVHWNAEEKTLRVLDQTLLPQEETYFVCADTACLYDAIKRLAIRGAPLIGISAAYGMVIAAHHEYKDDDASGLGSFLESKASYLISCRPTAVNLAWAVRRMLAIARSLGPAVAPGAGPDARASAVARLEAEAVEIHAEDARMCARMGELGRGLPGMAMTMTTEGQGQGQGEGKKMGILTHCNAGSLATGGIGTATALIYAKVCVWCGVAMQLRDGER